MFPNKRIRYKTGIVVETGEAREIAHFCLLVSYGAGAINPYLAFETFDQMIQDESSKQSNSNCHSLQLLGPNDHLLVNQNFQDCWLKKDSKDPRYRGFLNE